MPVESYFQAQLKELRCPTVNEKGFKCGRILGDFRIETEEDGKISPKSQNFFCPACHREWLAEMDGFGIIIFSSIPKNILKNYDRDTLVLREGA